MPWFMDDVEFDRAACERLAGLLENAASIVGDAGRDHESAAGDALQGWVGMSAASFSKDAASFDAAAHALQADLAAAGERVRERLAMAQRDQANRLQLRARHLDRLREEGT